MKIEKNSYDVCLIGTSLDTGNRGVSALCASLIKIILKLRPEAAFALLIGNRSTKPQELHLANRKVSLKVVNYRLSPKAQINKQLFWIFSMACFQKIMPFNSIRKAIIEANPFLKTMYYADFLGDIRGGDSFSDIYGLQRLIVGSIPSIIAILLGKKLVLLPQTYGPYNSNIGKHIARFVVSRASHVLSRDNEGPKTIYNLFGKKSYRKRIEFCPDVAFILDSIKPDRPDIHPPIDKKDKWPLIGFNINGLLYNGGYTRDNMFGLKLDYKSFVHKLSEILLAKTTAHIIFVPHTFGPPGNVERDPDACKDVLNTVADKYKKRVHIVMQEYDQSEIKGIINLCDFFIGSRMHACIAALSQGIPTVAVAYSKKFVGVFESVGNADMVVDARMMDINATIDLIYNRFQKRNTLKKGMVKYLGTIEAQITNTFNRLLINSDFGLHKTE